jgi:hypothetical protein
MSGWKYVKLDSAWHYFVEGASLCTFFTLKKRQFTPRSPNVENACGKCLKLSPVDSHSHASQVEF